MEVADVDAVHAMAIQRGDDIVYSLTSESWGVRRFDVLDPNGLIVNVMSHLNAAANRYQFKTRTAYRTVFSA
ncbi:MAG: hypothetical protein NVS9B12_14440 [Vulcanimicrobiaceae bacterium]